MDFASITLLLITCLLIVLIWLRNKYNYWKTRGVETPPHEFLFGNLRQVLLQQEHLGEAITRMYNDLKSKNMKHFGIYQLFDPMYIPVDINLIKSIMQNDFQHFVDRGMYINEKDDPLSAHLFNLEGKKWKLMRNKLSPTFTSGKMKLMFETLDKCSKQLTKVMEQELGSTVEIKKILNRFTVDVIGNCAFGIDTNSLENPDNAYVAKALPLFHSSFLKNIKNFLFSTSPNLMRFFGMQINSKDVINFFMDVVRDTVEYREKNNIYRKDFMHLLIQLKNRGQLVDDENLKDETIRNEDNKITLEQIAAQAFIFFEAGFETSSSTMAFCLYELGQNEDIQKKARDEINNILLKYDGNFTYEAITEMEYLERCVHETLRKYPVLSLLRRICTKEYKVPNTNVIIEKGVKVLIPIRAIQHDEEYYPDPEKFDPDRFLEERKRTRPSFTYLPFGEGPRVCIGMRFGLMQTKVGLATILRDYEVRTNEKSFPLEFDCKSIMLSNKRGIWLDYKKILPTPNKSM